MTALRVWICSAVELSETAMQKLTMSFCFRFDRTRTLLFDELVQWRRYQEQTVWYILSIVSQVKIDILYLRNFVNNQTFAKTETEMYIFYIEI